MSTTISPREHLEARLRDCARKYFPASTKEGYNVLVQHQVQLYASLLTVQHVPTGCTYSRAFDDLADIDARLLDKLMIEIAEAMPLLLAERGHYEPCRMATMHETYEQYPPPNQYKFRRRTSHDGEIVDALINVAGFVLGGRYAPNLGTRYYLIDQVTKRAHPISTLHTNVDTWKDILVNFVATRGFT